jgi:hypothetical protein
MPARKPKGELRHTEIFASQEAAQTRRQLWSPRVSTRVYARNVKADGLVLPVWVLVVRRKP